jgi:hypothetical protein
MLATEVSVRTAQLHTGSIKPTITLSKIQSGVRFLSLDWLKAAGLLELVLDVSSIACYFP